MENKELRKTKGIINKKYVLTHKGATEKTLDILNQML
jgi:hypothetical protein